MKRVINISFVTIYCLFNFTSLVMAQTVTVDNYKWNYYTKYNEVHSDYSNNQPHSATVTARGSKVYRASSNQANIRCSVTLKTTHGNKEAFYNYW